MKIKCFALASISVATEAVKLRAEAQTEDFIPDRMDEFARSEIHGLVQTLGESAVLGETTADVES